MSATGSPRSGRGDKQFVESEEDLAAAHTPVTLYASLSHDDTAKPTGQTCTIATLLCVQ